MVLRGFVTAWRFAASPTRRSPDFENATTEGVVRFPSEFSKTAGSPPSITAMHELVVPKSMPRTFAIKRVQIFVQKIQHAGYQSALLSIIRYTLEYYN